MPSKRRTWASHTLPGFYLGPSWEHYICHEVRIQETKAKRVGQTVFFKSKHITQPFLTMADALILTGEKLAQALSGAAPHRAATEAAVKQLMEIYKNNAKQEETNVDAQRVRRVVAQAQRVETEQCRDTKAWTRRDAKSKRFLTTTRNGPEWKDVVRRVTRRLDTMECIEDIEINSTLPDPYLHRALPEGVIGTQTTLYFQQQGSPTQGQTEAAEEEEQLEDMLDNVMVQGLEVTYPEQTEEDAGVPMVTQEDSPSQNTTLAS